MGVLDDLDTTMEAFKSEAVHRRAFEVGQVPTNHVMEDDIDAIHRMLAVYMQGSLASLVRIEEELSDIRDMLESEVEFGFADAGRVVDEWHGDAAENFAAFLSYADELRLNQAGLATELINLTRAHREWIRACRITAQQIADAALRAITQEDMGWSEFIPILETLAKALVKRLLIPSPKVRVAMTVGEVVYNFFTSGGEGCERLEDCLEARLEAGYTTAHVVANFYQVTLDLGRGADAAFDVIKDATLLVIRHIAENDDAKIIPGTMPDLAGLDSQGMEDFDFDDFRPAG